MNYAILEAVSEPGEGKRQDRARILLTLASLCLLLLGLTELFWFELLGLLWFLLLFVRWALAAMLAICIAAMVFIGIRRRNAVLPKAAALLVVLAGFVWIYGQSFGDRLRLALHRSEYERTVTRLRDAQRDGRVIAEDGGFYLADPGPPLRVAFPWPGGILDNWCGAIYDPTGFVRDFHRDETKRLFGGDITYCSGLGGPWYFCCFT